MSNCLSSNWIRAMMYLFWAFRIHLDYVIRSVPTLVMEHWCHLNPRQQFSQLLSAGHCMSNKTYITSRHPRGERGGISGCRHNVAESNWYSWALTHATVRSLLFYNFLQRAWSTDAKRTGNEVRMLCMWWWFDWLNAWWMSGCWVSVDITVRFVKHVPKCSLEL